MKAATTRRHAGSRRGLTLIEVMVASAVTLVLVALLMEILRLGGRTVVFAESHLEAIHAAQLQLERIENDLHHLLIESKHDLSLFDKTTLGAAGQKSISFRVAEPGPKEGPRGSPVYFGRRVTYEAVAGPDGHLRLARDKKVDGHLPVRDLGFEVVVQDAMGGVGRRYFVKTTLTCFDAKVRRELTLVGLTAIDLIGEWQRAPQYNPNPDRIEGTAVDAPVLAFVN